MKMRRSVGWLLAGVALETVVFAGWCVGQTPAQQATCQAHGEADVCGPLATEFATKDIANKGGSLSLDNPLGFGKPFLDRYKIIAYRQYLATQIGGEVRSAAEAALQTLSTAAATTQVGAAPTAGASTNLVTKPTTTDFLSLAAESGAFTDTLNGTSLTLGANALGLAKYFSAEHPMFQRWNSVGADQLQPWNFAVTLNVTQSGSTTVPAAGSANSGTPAGIASVLLPANNASFDSFTTSYTLYRPYNPQSTKFAESWKEALEANQPALDAASKTLAAAMQTFANPALIVPLLADPAFSPELARWHTAAQVAEAGATAADFDNFVAAYAAYEDAFYQFFASQPNGPKNFLSAVQAADAFNQATYIVLNQARTKLATASYIYSANGQKPATHAGKLAFANTWKGHPDPRTGKGSFLSGLQWTGNFAAEAYADVPAGAKYGRFKDVQLSTELDKPFGGTIAAPRGTLSVAGYGQYQYDPTVLNIAAGNLAPGTSIVLPGDAQVLLGTAGWLGVVQGKLTVNLSKGLALPVALKWSNKTDLLQADDIRGQIGLSYDLSALSKLLSR